VRARELVRPNVSADDMIACRIDQDELRTRLAELASTDAAIVRAERPSLVLEPGVGAHVAARTPSTERPAGSVFSDRLEIGVKATPAMGWQEYDLHVGLILARSGSPPLRLHPASAPMPDDHWLELDLLPAPRGDGPQVRAVIGFVRAVPIWPETGDL
jgi:hypothetical protein